MDLRRIDSRGSQSEELLEQLTLTRVPSAELEEQCFDIIRGELITDEDYYTKEKAILRLVELYSKNRNIDKLKALIHVVQPVVLKIKKSKTSKLMREILDKLAQSPSANLDLQIDLCKFLIKWCKDQNKNFVRHKIEIRLGKLYFAKGQYRDAITCIDSVLEEARALDNKHLLVEIQLTESKVYYSIQNFARAKSALTACKVSANSIYCSPLVQAEIDSHAGILNAEDLDFKTSYSYFYEAFEAYHQNSVRDLTIKNFQYMVLCKIMLNANDEVNTLLNGKHGMKYDGPEVTLMKKIAEAHKRKSLKQFQKVLKENEQEIKSDQVILAHVNNLYENLLEQNLMKIVEPYSRIELSYIATLIGLDIQGVQNKLSEMILDKKFDGTLDQGNGNLIIFETTKTGELYNHSLNTLENMNKVVDKLFEKAAQLKNME